MRNCDIFRLYDAAMASFIVQTNWKGYCIRPYVTFGQWLLEDSEVSRKAMMDGRAKIDNPNRQTGKEY